jgi:ABC-type polysaccharide transport system permease subunit
MLVMPDVFVLLLKGAGSGVVDLTSASGILSATIAVVLFAAAYYIGKRILKIEL